jgi:signal transduction histidine kinase
MNNRNPLGNRLLLVGVCSIAVVAAFVLLVAELAVRKIDPDELARVRTNAFRRLEHVRDQVLHATGSAPGIRPDAILEVSEKLHPLLQRIATENSVCAYVMVVSTNGIVLAHSDETRAPAPLPADVFGQLTLADQLEPREVRLDSWFGAGRIIDYAMPVIVDRRALASVHLGVSQPRLAQRTAAQQASIHRWVRVTVTVSVAIFCMAGAVAWRLVLNARRTDATERRRDHLAEVGKLADGLVHEIRNPLNAMRMQVAVIRNQLKKLKEPALEVAKAQLERLESEVLRLQDLATDFLTFGRPEIGCAEHFALADLLSDVGDFLRPELEQRNIRFSLDVEPAAQGAIVAMDRGKFRQVLLNLAANSEHAMLDGGTLSIILTKASRHSLNIAVRDTGCGISRDKLTRVFDAFFSTKDEGNGLGLSIAKKIVDGVGGSIAIASEVGRGTTVEINVPISQSAKSGDTPPQSVRERDEVTV